MKPLRGCYRLAALSLIVLFCSRTPVDAQSAPREQPRFGGVLKVAMNSEAPSLDPHGSSASITEYIMWHVFETLYTFDKDRSPIPHLAEGHTVSDGGRQYAITLRKGVRFHNGKEMTSADVMASLNRWGRMATAGKALWKSVGAVTAKGPYEIVVHLKEPSGVVVSTLAVAWNGATIYPKEIIDATGNGQLKQFIGTGPYRFAGIGRAVTSGSPASRSTRHGPNHRTAAPAASASPTWTRFSSSPSLISPRGWRALSPVPITTAGR